MSKKKNNKPKSENRELLFSVTMADCEFQTFSAGGPGGQHQNTSNTAVRIIHRASGAVGVSREDRSQTVNKKKAFVRMTEDKRFKAWINKQIWFRGETPEQRVRKDMDSMNLKFEVKDEEGNWRITSDTLIGWREQ